MLKKLFKNLGPGPLIAAAFIGPGTVTLCTLAGVKFGMSLLWTLLIAVLASITLQSLVIDIIAIDNEELVFIEVKTRSNSLQQLGEIITTSQQKRIISAADSFIKENKIDLDVRFDMILIEKTIKSYKFTHIKEIFFPTFD